MEHSEQIRKIAQEYFKSYDLNDFAHSFEHVKRVHNLAILIGEKENADLEVLDAAAYLHDVARSMEDRGEIENHAVEGAKIAEKILNEIGFPESKIANVVHSIRSHRCRDVEAETLEAKVLQDADRLDALGAVDIARVIASGFQSVKFRRPVYIDKPYRGNIDADISSIHYMISKVREPKRLPKNFNTEMGKKIAQKRMRFSKNFIKRFKTEWKGKA